MVQKLGALAALPEDPHGDAFCNTLLQGIQLPFLTSKSTRQLNDTHIYMQANTHIHKITF